MVAITQNMNTSQEVVYLLPQHYWERTKHCCPHFEEGVIEDEVLGHKGLLSILATQRIK